MLFDDYSTRVPHYDIVVSYDCTGALSARKVSGALYVGARGVLGGCSVVGL